VGVLRISSFYIEVCSLSYLKYFGLGRVDDCRRSRVPRTRAAWRYDRAVVPALSTIWRVEGLVATIRRMAPAALPSAPRMIGHSGRCYA
jgi:hypothetical protein